MMDASTFDGVPWGAVVVIGGVMAGAAKALISYLDKRDNESEARFKQDIETLREEARERDAKAESRYEHLMASHDLLKEEVHQLKLAIVQGIANVQAMETFTDGLGDDVRKRFRDHLERTLDGLMSVHKQSMKP